MSRRPEKKYGPAGRYYRKRIRRPDGKWEDVYALTTAELADKVTVRQAQLAAEAAGHAPDPYVFEYAAAFFARRAPHLSSDRQQLYRYQINKVICPVIGGRPMTEITLDDLQDVLATRAHLSRRSQEDTVQILKQIFSAALDSDVIARDPSLKLKPGGKPPQKRQALTEAQQTALLDAVRGLAVEPMVWLGIFTGMRRGEICGLRWDCVHLDGAAPYVSVRRACRWPDKVRPEVNETLKSEAAFRDIPIPPRLVDYLRDLRAARLAALDQKKKKAPSPVGGGVPDAPHPGAGGRGSAAEQLLLGQYVYADKKGGAVSYSTLRRRWETIKTRSTASGRALGEKIKNHPVTVTLDFFPTPHVLRHTYVTRLVLAGMDLKRVQYLAGHSDPEITLQIYTSLQHASPEDLSADVWAAFDAADDPSE